jgi:hypothetical protein
MFFNYFKSWVLAPNKKNYLGLEDNIYRALGITTNYTIKWVSLIFREIIENNYSFNKDNKVNNNLLITKPLDYSTCEEALIGYLSPYNY